MVDWWQFPHVHRALRLLDMLGEAPLSLVRVAHLLPEEIAGFVDPACPQFDAFKHHGRDSPFERPVLVHPCSFGACLNDHGLAECGPIRATAHGRRGAEANGSPQPGCAPTVSEDPVIWQRWLALARHARGG